MDCGVCDDNESMTPGSGERFARPTIDRLLSPCLYIWWRGETPLYVGQSIRGVARAFDTVDRRVWRDDPRGRWQLRPTDEVEILWRPGASPKRLLDEEAQLIRELLPRWNTRGVPIPQS